MAALPSLATDRVLSTLNVDGSRRWIRPRPSPGPWWRRRRTVAWALMLVFFLLPYLNIAGKPAILLDLPRRQFTLFGVTFLPTDTLLFMLLFASAGLAIFLATALFGRVWCGWGCPQTVYLEFVFRPIERWLEGGARGSLELDRRHAWLHPRRLLKNAIYGLLALFLSHTFLAYFVGIETLVEWIQRSPVEHPLSFLVMAGTATAIFLDFAWFREQTCLVACPYGRLQSVLLDRRSWIVGYDVRRGEPRGRGVRTRAAGSGDCIDCAMCVQTCPTGIDIREGLQMECIHCTQCIDACDAVMTKIGKPPGLIRYSSRDGFERRDAGMLRPRVIAYPVLLVAAVGLLVWQLRVRPEADVTLLRGIGAPYVVQPGGAVSNQVRVKIANRGGQERAYTIALGGAPDARLIAPMNPLVVPAGTSRTTSVFVIVDADEFEDGERDLEFRIGDGVRYARTFEWDLVGPDRTDAHREDAVNERDPRTPDEAGAPR